MATTSCKQFWARCHSKQKHGILLPKKSWLNKCKLKQLKPKGNQRENDSSRQWSLRVAWSHVPGATRPVFKGGLCHLLAVQVWERHGTRAGLSLLLCKMEIVIMTDTYCYCCCGQSNQVWHGADENTYVLECYWGSFGCWWINQFKVHSIFAFETWQKNYC